LSHHGLVVSEGEGFRGRENGRAGLAQVAQVIQWHVLVVESDDVDAICESHEVLEVREITNMARPEPRGQTLRLGKYPEFEAQIDGCRNHHPR
jgi:hypothetical protein